jgi:hypothetical protein
MDQELSEEKFLVYGTYSQIADILKHRDSIQATYRTFASTWLLATFVGIGYALSSKETSIPFHPLLAVAFISLASATGIFIIWLMDLVSCEQSIASMVYNGMELERQHAWLPHYYHNVNEMGSLRKFIRLKALFYNGCLSILFITMGTSLTLYASISNHFSRFFIPVFTIFLILLVRFAILSSMRKNDPYKRIEELKRKNHV